MLAIRMQRTGRRGHAQFRLVVQDSRFSPTSGRVVAYLGNYDPHTKTANFDKEKAAKYLGNGARPSDRVAGLLKKEGVKLPSWVRVSAPHKRPIRHPEKLRRNRPAGQTQTADAAVPDADTAENAPAEKEAAAAQDAKDVLPKDEKPTENS